MSGTFRLDIKHSIDDFVRRIDDAERWRVPYVTAAALSQTARDIKDAEVAIMAQVFDRPTRFTLNALYVDPATKNRLSAYVKFKDQAGAVPAWRYLDPQVEGGRRVHKAHERLLIRTGNMKPDEFAMPGKGMPLDAHGNISGAVMNKILSDLQLRNDPQQNTTARSRRRAKARGRYMIFRPELIGFSSYSGRNVQPGIYYRAPSARAIVPIIVFVRAPNYAKRFPFYETARRVMRERFPLRFRENWDRLASRIPTGR